MKYYLAYGSNLNMRQMKMRCPGAVPVGTMVLHGYELVFKGPLTIEERNNGIVPIGIWKVDESDEKALDRYEGFPILYTKKEISIEGDKKGFIYIMNDKKPYMAPHKHYVDICKEGYGDFGFNTKHIDKALSMFEGGHINED